MACEKSNRFSHPLGLRILVGVRPWTSRESSMPHHVLRFIVPLRVALAAGCSMLIAVSAASAQADSPVAVWQQRLARVEAGLRRVPASDVASQQRLAGDLSALRQEVRAFLAGFPPAQADTKPWLDEAGTSPGLEELAAEVGRLRSAISRIAAAGGQGAGSGAFYLGRVDVAVTAEATVAATTEMTPAGASVLTAADLQASDRGALAGALSLAPGVTFTRIGQRNETAVYVRGYDMRQVPLFIDGVPIYTPYDGYVDLDRFTTYDVAELNVSKGFASVLYGPNALGGAINIVSRRPSAPLQGQATVGYATGSSLTLSLNGGSRFSRFYVQGGASYLDADTFPMAQDFQPTRNQPAGDRLNAYRQDAKFNVKLGWTPNGRDEYAVSYVGQRAEKGNPPYAGTDPLVKIRYWKWPYWDKDSVYFVSNTRVGSSSYIRGRAFYDTYDNALYSYDDASYTTMNKASSFKSLYHDYTAGGSVEWGASIGSHTLRAAGHYKGDAHEDHNLGEPVKHFEGRIVSAGVEDTWTIGGKLSLVVGASGDWQSTTRAEDYQKGQVIDLMKTCKADGTSCGDASGFNPQAGLFYAVPSGQVRVTVARKTRMPSLKDRYSYKMGTAVPNPDLKAEHNLTLEGGYQGTLGSRTSFQASVFYSRIDDMIQRYYLQPNLSQLRNVGEASSGGIELDARTRLVPRLDLGANYTFLDRQNISDPKTPLIDAPRHKGRVAVTATLAQWMRVVAGIDFESGRRTQNEGGTYFDVPSFATMNVKAAVTVRRALDVEIALLNAFDKYYWVAEGYPETGRTVLATLRYSF
jgi:iron complex outermembrane recepter protein